jgi:hypothetical protein
MTILNVTTGQIKKHSDTARCHECYSVSKNGMGLCLAKLCQNSLR